MANSTIPEESGRRCRHVLVTAMIVIGVCGCERSGEYPPNADAEYEIVVERIGRIGDLDGDGMLIGTTQVNFLRDGRIALNDRSDPGRVKFYLADGTFLGVFGNPGEGPAEFRQPIHQFLVPSGDTLVVLDNGLGRITHWAPDGSELYDTELFPTYENALFLDDGRVILNSPTISPNGRSFPLRLVSREGEVIRSFGTPSRMDLPFETRPHFRILSNGAGGSIWAVPLFEYHVTHWDTLGNLVGEFRGDHVTMPPPGEQVVTPDSPRGPPPTPYLGGIGWDEEEGVLWVAISVPNEDWAARLRARDPERISSIEDRYTPERSLRRTRLDAWDPERGELIASTLLGERWRMPMGPGVAVSYSSSPEGYLFLDVWRARLVKRR